MNRSVESQQAAEIKRWADTQGFRVGRPRVEAGRTVYPVTWWDLLQSNKQTTVVEDLSELPQYIRSLIEGGKVRRPGEFYVYWCVERLWRSPWCRTPAWVRVAIHEGRPMYGPWTADKATDGFDPTPYTSVQEAVDSVALLGQELEARLCFYAKVMYVALEGKKFPSWKVEEIPTASYSKEAIEEQILDLVRHSAYRRLKIERYHNDVTSLAGELLAIGLSWDMGIQAVERMIDEGRLVREWQRESHWWKRWLKRWQDRKTTCFVEAGWKCELISCVKCEGTGKCLVCGGSGMGPTTDERGEELPCIGCGGMLLPLRGEGYNYYRGSGDCQRCARKGKVCQWQQETTINRS